MAYKVTASAEDKRYIERRIAAIAKELEEYTATLECGIHVDTGYSPKYGVHTHVWLFSKDGMLQVESDDIPCRNWLDRDFCER